MQSIIHTPTPDVSQSIEFYERLNFRTINQSDPLLVTDGKVLVEINPDRFARAGIRLFRDNWDETVTRLASRSAVTNLNNGHLVYDPSGVAVYLMSGTAPVSFEPEESCFGLTGNFAGMSVESNDMNASYQFWNTLGFEKTHGEITGGWIACTNADGMAVSMMRTQSCPHLFFNPSLTYFNGKGNTEVIQAIRDAGIPITEEITVFNDAGIVDNIIIRDPGGYGFFLFSD